MTGGGRPRAIAVACLLLLGALAVGAPAAADSIFSALGLGEAVTTADMRGRGMGNTSTGTDDPWNLGRANPATLAKIRAYFLSGELLREKRWIDSDAGGTSDPLSTNLPQVRVGLAVPKVGVLALGLADMTQVSYALREVTQESGETVIRTLSGKNGLETLTLSYARQIQPRIAIGVDLDFVLGSFQDIWQTDFVDPTGFDTVDSLIVEHSKGPMLRLGVLGRAHQRLDLGAALTFGRDIELRPEIKSEGGRSEDLPRYDLHLPLTLALGASGDISHAWRGAFDFTYINGSSTDLTLGTDPILNRRFVPTLDVVKLGFGVEYQRDRLGEARGYFHHVPIRAGFAWEPWAILDTHGEKIEDKFITAGAGFPVGDQVGMIQVAMQYGWRGSIEKNDAEEQILRFGIGFTAREKVAVEKGRRR